MTEAPETIVLKRLPPEHVLRKGVDWLANDDEHPFEVADALAGHTVKDASRRSYPACYCRQEDWPVEYDEPEPGSESGSVPFGKVAGTMRCTFTPAPKPSIDPGEGWRIYDVKTEGNDPREDAEYWSAYDRGWSKRRFPRERMTDRDVYRVPVDQQVTKATDELTTLRQQCQRKAERIEELEKERDELKAKASPGPWYEAWARVVSTLDQCCPDWNSDGGRAPMKAACKAIRDMAEERDQLKTKKVSGTWYEAWVSVVDTLDQHCGNWNSLNGGRDPAKSACKAIRDIAEQVKSLEKERDELGLLSAAWRSVAAVISEVCNIGPSIDWKKPEIDRAVIAIRRLVEERDKAKSDLEEMTAERDELNEDVESHRNVNGALRKSISNKNDQIQALSAEVSALKVELDELKNWRQKIGEALDRIEPDWLDRLNDSAVLCAVRKIEEMDDLILTKDRLIKAHREVLDDVEKECDALKAELASRPAALRWERRKPTEQECRERFYLTRIIGEKWPQFREPDETNADNWRDDVETCVLPDILPAEPPKTVTLRRWLVCEDDDWLDVWIDEGAEPQGEWDEMIKTDKTQEVPE
jgi:flagellar biosynthesis chaperone FliJ